MHIGGDKNSDERNVTTRNSRERLRRSLDQ